MNNKYRCEKCDGLIQPDKSKLTTGDMVSFTHSTSRGKTVRMTALEGEIVECHKDDSLSIKVKRRGVFRVYRRSVYPVDAPSPITYQLLDKCQCGVK